MTDPNGAPAPPITVHRSPARDVATTGAIGMVALGAGIVAGQLFHSDILTKATLDSVTVFLNALPSIWSVLVGAATVGAGMVRTFWRHKQRVKLAEAAPNEVGQVV